MSERAVIHGVEIGPELIDYNGHLTEWAYYRIFSDALTKLLEQIGVGEEYRRVTGRTMYSLESHGVFIKEATSAGRLEVTFRVLDFDEKRTHILLDLHDGGTHLASYENVSLHVRQSADAPPRAARMPDQTLAWLRERKVISDGSEWPPYAGRGLSLARKRT